MTFDGESYIAESTAPLLANQFCNPMYGTLPTMTGSDISPPTAISLLRGADISFTNCR